MDGADAIKYILANNIEGDIVECGVYNGNFQVIWIEELQKQGAIRDLYLFDTFEGLVEPGEHDYTADTALLYNMNKDTVKDYWKNQKIDDNTNGWCYCPLDSVKERLNSTGYSQDHIHYVVGDVLETLKDRSNIPDKIAILRLDTDWYESSKYELEQMYDNVVDGGVIIFDDYLHWNGQRKATDEFFESRGIKYDIIDLHNGKTTAIIKNVTL